MPMQIGGKLRGGLQACGRSHVNEYLSDCPARNDGLRSGIPVLPFVRVLISRLGVDGY